MSNLLNSLMKYSLLFLLAAFIFTGCGGGGSGGGVDNKPIPGPTGKTALTISGPGSTCSVDCGTTCSASSVQAAVDAASDGDTVTIPNGSCTWTSGVRISKQLRITAQSKGSVNITHGAGSGTLFTITTGSRYNTEISNINFMPGSATGNYMTIRGTGKPPLIHNNYFRVPDWQLVAAIRYERYNGGIIYGNTFESLTTSGAAGSSGTGSGCLQIKDMGGSASWSSASTMGTDDTTGLNNVYIEGNTFNNIYLQAIDCDDNSRVVIRQNTFNDSGFGTHGADTSTHGVRHIEVYNNLFVFHPSGTGFGGAIHYPLNLNWWMYLRGGTGIFANNEIHVITSKTWGLKSELNFIVQNLQRDSGPDPCCHEYPCLHQIGRGQNNTLEPFYIWGNTGTGTQTPSLADYGCNDPNTSCKDSGCASRLTANFVVAGRDYYVGTAKPGWTRYTCPHPLAGSGSCSGTGATAYVLTPASTAPPVNSQSQPLQHR
jgi:hypothetical protein